MRISALLLLLASAASAQSAPQVRGVVYDSVANAPLRGAVVQVALVDSSAPTPRLFSGVSDSAGHYVVSGLVPGRYVIGFQHDALLALGIDAPLRSFEIVAGSDVASVDLATPSPAVLRAVRCGSTDPQRPGMLSGIVTDARSAALPTGSFVEVHWTEVGVKDRKIKAVPFSVRANIGDDGSFLACNLTTDATLSVRVAATGHRTLNGEVIVPTSGVLLRDFTLADTGAMAGSARLAGRVLLADGKPLPSGQALIASLGIEVPVTDGQFTMQGVPAGTWLVDARAIGYEPKTALVDVGEGATASLTIRLTTRAQVLDAVTVVGASNNREIKVLEGIRERSRMSSGTVFGPGSEALKAAMFPADVVRYARGFKYVSPTVVFGRSQVMTQDQDHVQCGDPRCATVNVVRTRGQSANNEPCSTEIDDAMIVSPLQKKKRVILYVDGLVFNGSLEMLNTTIQMSDILAIEAYPDVANAPPQWRTQEACAIIAVWKKP